MKKPWSLPRKVERFLQKPPQELLRGWLRLEEKAGVLVEERLGPQPDFDLRLLPRKRVVRYSGRDPDATLRLLRHQEPLIREQGLQRTLDIDLGTIPLCADMMHNGMLVDVPKLQELSEQWGRDLAGIEERCWEEAGERFNVGSPDQIAPLLFERWGLPMLRRARKKERGSTDEKVLQELKARLESAPEQDERTERGKRLLTLILEYRELQKLKGTYADALIRRALADPEGRIHTRLKLTTTDTGRLASAEPNLQNIPVRTEIGREIRKAFIVPPGRRMLSVDLSQIELRVVAHLSEDEAMVAAFRSGADIHKATASQLWNIPLAEVTKAQRSRAKAGNFGVIYRQGAPGLAETQGITLQEAESFLRDYFRRFWGVKFWSDSTVGFAIENGYVYDMFGRRRWVPGVFSEDRGIREEALRQAGNMPVQSSAASILKIAMAQCLPAFEAAGLLQAGCRFLLQIHDELLVEAPEELAEEAGALLKAIMEHAVELIVPVVADVSIGRNWGELKE